MPLPSLKAHRAADANAREYQKRVMLGESPDAAAAAVGGPAHMLATHEGAQALARATADDKALLEGTEDKSVARLALDTREGRAAWLEGVVHGEVKCEGAFGMVKEFPPTLKLKALQLRGQMDGDYVQRFDVNMNQNTVIVFEIPDNGRVPREIVEALPAQASEP